MTQQPQPQSQRRNGKLLAARLWFHDNTCISGSECSSREDHASRTQRRNARALVDAGTDRERATVLHEAFCIRSQQGVCPCPEAHVDRALSDLLPKVQI